MIGAGVAGIAAARALVDAGHDVTVFDKARGAGGRTSTRRSPPHAFDHGAQYFTARDPAFVAAVADARAAGAVAVWDGSIVSLRAGHVEPEQSTTRYVGVPAMNALVKHMAEGLDVRFDVRVGAVTRSEGVWRLASTDAADLGRFDTVLVTTPPPQAVPLLAAVPALAQRAGAIRMLPCWAVMVAFERRPDVPFEGAFVHDSPLGWIARDSGKPGRPPGEAWVLQASPEWSAAYVDARPDVVVAALLYAFARATGTSPPTTTHTAAHRWMYARTDEALGTPFLLAREHRIGAAGDWCLGARVEAAYLSGRALAGALLPDGT